MDEIRNLSTAYQLHGIIGGETDDIHAGRIELHNAANQRRKESEKVESAGRQQSEQHSEQQRK